MLCLLFIISFYVVASPMVARSFYYQMLFPRSVYPDGYYQEMRVDGVEAEDVYFEVGGERLHGWYFHKPGAQKTVLMHHGNGGNISILNFYADLVLKSNASFFVYDYEGYGRSTGQPSITNVLRDSEAAYQYLNEVRKVPEKDIVNLGLSLGTGLAIQIAAKHPGAGLILLAPYKTLWTTSKYILGFLAAYPDQLWPERDIDSITAIKGVSCPILIMHGDRDQMMPFSNSEELKSHANKYTKLVKLSCGHADLMEDRNTVLENIKNFLSPPELTPNSQAPKFQAPKHSRTRSLRLSNT